MAHPVLNPKFFSIAVSRSIGDIMFKSSQCVVEGGGGRGLIVFFFFFFFLFSFGPDGTHSFSTFIRASSCLTFFPSISLRCAHLLHPWPCSLPHRYTNDKQSGLVATPSIRSINLDRDTDRFLLLACDGLFDVFEPQQAVDFVLNHEKLHESPQVRRLWRRRLFGLFLIM